MYKDKVSIVIPVKENPNVVRGFVSGNLDILKNYPVYVVNKEGGEILEKFYSYLKDTTLDMVAARKKGLEWVTTEFVVMLDVDTVLPKGFIDAALLVFSNHINVVVVALDYEKSQGHYAFGASIWRTEILKDLYDIDPRKDLCECMQMWHKVQQSGFLIKTLNMRAEHLRKDVEYVGC